MIDHLLKKYIPRLLRGMHREFKVPVEKQKKLLNSFNEPKNNFDRSFYQYKCQELFWGKLFYLAASIAAAVLLPYQLYRLKKNREEIKNGRKPEQIDLILVADEMPEGIFPPQVLNEYPGHKKRRPAPFLIHGHPGHPPVYRHHRRQYPLWAAECNR